MEAPPWIRLGSNPSRNGHRTSGGALLCLAPGCLMVDLIYPPTSWSTMDRTGPSTSHGCSVWLGSGAWRVEPVSFLGPSLDSVTEFWLTFPQTPPYYLYGAKHPSVSTSLHSISWVAGTTITESKQRLLSEVATLWRSGDSVVGSLAIPLQKTQDSLVQAPPQTCIALPPNPPALQKRNNNNNKNIYALVRVKHLQARMYLRYPWKVTTTTLRRGLGIFFYFFCLLLITLLTVICCGFFLVTNVVIESCLGQRRLLNSLNVSGAKLLND